MDWLLKKKKTEPWTQWCKGRARWNGRLDVTSMLRSVKQTASGELLHSTGAGWLSPALHGDLERGMRVGGRRSKREGVRVHLWPIHFVVEQKLTQDCVQQLYPNLEKKKRERESLKVLNIPFFFPSLTHLHCPIQIEQRIALEMEGKQQRELQYN